jgi:hypothetical protein
MPWDRLAIFSRLGDIHGCAELERGYPGGRGPPWAASLNASVASGTQFAQLLSHCKWGLQQGGDFPGSNWGTKDWSCDQISGNNNIVLVLSETVLVLVIESRQS